VKIAAKKTDRTASRVRTVVVIMRIRMP